MEIPLCKSEPNFRKFISIRNYNGNDIEQKASELYQCLVKISKSDEKYVYLYLRITNSNLTLANHSKDEDLSVKLPKNFKIILLSSLRHLKVYDKPQNFSMKSLIHVIVKDILCTLDYLDFRTLYLFKVLDQVVLNKKLDLISDIQESVLSKLYEVCYASPIAILRNSAVSMIHKMALKLGNGLKTFNPLVNIGILTNYDETKIKLEQIKSESINSNLEEYMKFIHRYFHFNVYNKVSGILYKAVISRYSINDFKTYIWPYWSESFEKHSNSREFQQSFLKYWIPFTVQEYKTDLYVLLRDQKVPQKLLVEILFTLRRKRLITVETLSEGKFYEDFMQFLASIETRDKGFEILCMFPSISEGVPEKWLEIFEEYFLGSKIDNNSSEKHAGQFLAHIFMCGHLNIEKNETNSIYDNFLRKLKTFIIDSLNEEKNYEVSLKLCKILVGMKKPCKDLKLRYDIPKKYQYGPEENKYLSYLQDEGILDIFTEQKEHITAKLVKIFNENITCVDTIWLLKNAFDTFQIEDLTSSKIQNSENRISLSTLEKYTDCQKLSLYKTTKERDPEQILLSFVIIEHQIALALKNVNVSEKSAEEIFNILKILNVLVGANQMKIAGECQTATVINMLNFMVFVLEENRHEGLSARTRKVLEHAFCQMLTILHLSPTTLTEYGDLILQKLVIVIEKSNMKKVVTDVLNLVIVIAERMSVSNGKSQKYLNKFFRELLNVIVSPANLDHLQKSRMRKHPRLRSLLHAVCKGAGTRQRDYVNEALKKIIWKTKQHKLDPTIHTTLLECLEIMIVEPNFHNYTFTYLEETIKLGLNSFKSNNWSVKNAAIQLTNTVITRIFGVQQTDNIRLRSFQEFCILFPKLSDQFYDILSSPTLDDSAIIVLQYLSASEVLVYEHKNEEVQKKIKKFLSLLEHLLRSKENYITKFIPHAFVNLSVPELYLYYMRKVFRFVLSNLNKKPTNVIVNHLILFKEFVRKINENYSYVKPMKVDIEHALIDVVIKMNDFLSNKNLQYLDLHNIRHFVLDQCTESCNREINLNVSLKRWNLYNLIVNFPSFYLLNNFQQLFELMYDKVELNFLLEIFLDQTISYALENQDIELISTIFNTLATKILKSEKNKQLNRVFLESILKLNELVNYISLEDNLCNNLKDSNLNYYQAVVIHIVLSTQNRENSSELCDQAFKKLSQFRYLDNFEIELIPKVLIFVHKNLNISNRFNFLKFLFFLMLTDCDKEDICDFLTKICGKFVNEDNYMSNLLNYEFLYDYFRNCEVVKTFLTEALRLINQFEEKTKFATFYMDTYQSLQIQKDVINKMMMKF